MMKKLKKMIVLIGKIYNYRYLVAHDFSRGIDDKMLR